MERMKEDQECNKMDLRVRSEAKLSTLTKTWLLNKITYMQNGL